VVFAFEVLRFMVSALRLGEGGSKVPEPSPQWGSGFLPPS